MTYHIVPDNRPLLQPDHEHLAAAPHNHDGTYSPVSHNHDSDYSPVTHDHDADYSTLGHDHDADYSAITHDHDSDYSAIGHNHSGVYAPVSHDHAAGDITSGTLNIARIPTGTSGSTVALGNHGHSFPDGSVGSPGIPFTSDPDTGIYRVGPNVWGVATGGSLSLQVGTAVTISIPSTTGSGTALMVTDPDSNGNYTILRSSSARKYKSRINYNLKQLADIELKPAKFYREDDDAWYYGFIADDLAEEDSLLGIYDPDTGEVENYDQRAVMAVMAAKINRLEQVVGIPY